MADLTDGQVRENTLRDGGFSDDEINQWKGETAQTLQQGGFSADEVKSYFGQKEPDMSAAKSVVQNNLKQAAQTPKPKREPIDVSVKPVEAKDIWDSLAAGWGNSVLGLLTSGGESPLQNPENATAAQTLVSSAAQLAGDTPAMAAGMVSGAAAGAGVGTTTLPVIGTISGAAVGGGAGAFAVPAAMRKVLIDHYKKGDIQDAGDFARRVVDTTWEATKGALTGVANTIAAPVGGSVGVAAAEKLGGGMLTQALSQTGGRLAAEIAAQTTVSSALEGHLPHQKDFINTAIAIGGLHAVGFGVGKSGYIADKLMNIYAETGALPHDVAEAANSDPALKGELLSEDPELPVKPAEQPEAPATETTAAEPVEKSPTQDLRDEILGRIGEKKEPVKLPIKERLENEINSKYAKYLDYTSIVKDKMAEIGEQPLNKDNAYVLMRLHNAVQDKVNDVIDNNTVDFSTNTPNGEGYKTIIGDLQKMGPDAVKDWNAYRIAARSLELADQGKDQTGSRETDRAFVEAHPEFKEITDRYVAFKNRLVDNMVDSGRISKEGGQAMKDLGKSYAPLKKILEVDPKTGELPFSSRDIKRIGSSDLQLVDPFESDLRDISNMVRLSRETEAANTYIKNMGYEPSENQGGIPGKNQIASYENGQRTLYDVTEAEADAIKRMAGNNPALDVYSKTMRTFAGALRMGTVDNPLFGLRHAWRQQITSGTLSQTDLKPFQNLMYAPEYFMKGDSYKQFVRDGGAVSNIMPRLNDWMKDTIYDLNKDAPFLDKAWNVVKTVGGLSHSIISEHDNIIRFAEYQRMLEKGATREESAFAAREVLPDFQKVGLQKSALQAVTAFLDVHLKGQARMFQELNENPKEYIAKNIAYITVPSLLLAAAQYNDDAIKDLPDWQKFAYWTVHIPNWRSANSLAEAMSVKSAYPSNTRQMPDGSWQVNDGKIVRIQKPFTNGMIFGSMIDATLEAFQKKDPKAFGDFVKTVGGSVIAEPIPTALTPVLEQYTNRNFYTGTPLIRQSMENKLPEMQYDQYTSETAKALGKLLSYVPLVKDIGPKDAHITSPKVIENYIHGWGGTMGVYAVDVLDKGLRAAGIAPPDVKPTDTLADIPFVKEFVIRFPNARPQSISDFEDRYQRADQVSNSIKQLMKQGDVKGAVDLQNRYAVNMDRMQGVDKAIKNLNASIQKVNQTPDIDPVQKRQLIDMMMYQMTSMAKDGNKLMDEFEKRAKN